MKHFLAVVFGLAFAIPSLAQAAANPVRKTLDLSGVWRVQLDRDSKGETLGWAQSPLKDSLAAHLPGSLNTNGIGDEVGPKTPWMGDTGRGGFSTDERYAPYRQPGPDFKVPFWLQPDKYYTGAAWYQREVDIPADWKDKNIVLNLERCHWKSTVYLDGRSLGSRDSLGTPHRYHLEAAKPGRHLLTVRVDNSYHIRVGPDASSITDHTQTNWNGIVGEISLEAADPVHIESLQAYPDLANKSVRLRGTVANPAASPFSRSMKVEAASFNSTAVHRPAPVEIKINGDGSFEGMMPMGENVLLWDEFNPVLYRLTATLSGTSFSDRKIITFGMREIKTDGRRFMINGVPRFMRGTLDCAAFPKTGHPAMDLPEWRRIFKTCKAYGLNHVRYHSWCPPEAAFEAADLEGMYLQIECGVWRGTCPFKNAAPVEPFLYSEAERILKTYGNHPSFVLFSHGNEPWELDQKKLANEWVPAIKKMDRRMLVAAGAHFPVHANNDFQDAGPMGGMVLRYHNGFTTPPSTSGTYESIIGKEPAPVISHEPGEWCAYPDLNEISQYTGCMKARNFEIVRDFMKQNHLLPKARKFLMASGRFQTILYKEETEKFLRTPNLGGFQMLGLNDFPGQGTALVGALNALWKPKPYVNAGEYHAFSGPVVPLVMMEKRVWTNDETFTAAVRIAQYSGGTLKDAEPEWKITGNDGRVLASGKFAPTDIPVGNTTTLGHVSFSLLSVTKAARLVLEVSLASTGWRNEWSFWVYPKRPNESPGEALACSEPAEALEKLARGQTVVLLANAKQIAGNAHGSFQPIFWNKPWFPGQKEHTVGWLVRNDHPALKNFPTDDHTDWQWWDLMQRGKPMILDPMPPELDPIVEPIDDWNTCHRLATVIEAKVGPGKLLLCSIDLVGDLDSRPVARQLRTSLLDHAASPDFDPTVKLTAEQVAQLFKSPADKLISRVDANSENTGHPVANAFDDDPKTFWHSEWLKNATGYPHEIKIQLAAERTVTGVSILPRQDGNKNGWVKGIEVETSLDGKTWTRVATEELPNNQEWKKLAFAPVKAKFVKIRAIAPQDSNQKFASFGSFAEVSINVPK
ncbi:MAG: discoidin domain-containing protein [Verrucomicrobiota bacterium]